MHVVWFTICYILLRFVTRCSSPIFFKIYFIIHGLYFPRSIHRVHTLCFVAVWFWLLSPVYSGLFHWHWGNHIIAPVPVKQPWRIWVIDYMNPLGTCIVMTSISSRVPDPKLVAVTWLNGWVNSPGNGCLTGMPHTIFIRYVCLAGVWGAKNQGFIAFSC